MSPLIRPVERGRFGAAVSIRSGAGTMTHDRVMRFAPLFDTHEQATRFAVDQAMAWIGRPPCEAATPTTSQE